MAYILWNLFLVSCLLLVSDCTADTEKCVQDPGNSCICHFNPYKKIDLTNFAPSNEPTYQITDQSGNLTYHFHGCTDGKFEVMDNTSNKTKVVEASLLVVNTTVTVTNKNGTNITVITNTTTSYKAAQIKFSQDSENPNVYQIVYTEKDKNKDDAVVASILLVCVNYNTNILKVTNAKSNELDLVSPHACTVINHPGLSSGSVMLILFFTGLCIYLVGGMLILYFIRGARGVEIIPNIDFWRSLPGLVKDGTIFLLSGCRPTFVSTSDSYDRI